MYGWSYAGERGPAHWGDLGPELAACKGSRQSPVDLSAGRPVQHAPLTFRYRSSPLSLVNDGRSLRGRYSPGSTLVAGGREFELEEFHFHVPREHHISGVRADMELQLTHRDRQDRLAVVAVPMKAGRRMNSTLSRIWDNMPAGSGTTHYDRHMGIPPAVLLPSDRGYFTYPGSLTEPPLYRGGRVVRPRRAGGGEPELHPPLSPDHQALHPSDPAAEWPAGDCRATALARLEACPGRGSKRQGAKGWDQGVHA